MKIGINLLDLYPGKIGGMEQYIRNTIYFMDNKYKHNFYLFLNEYNYDTFEGSDTIKKILIDINCDREAQIYKQMNKYDLDVWFCPLLVLEPRYTNIPSLITIPDIQHEFFPEYFNEKVLEFRRNNYIDSIDKADLVLTISDFSKKTFIEKYGIEESKIKVTLLDADKVFYEKYDKLQNDLIMTKYKLPEKYIFFPSNSWPHKNHQNLLKAYNIYLSKYDSDMKLVLTGDKKEQSKSMLKYISDHKLDNNILYLGYINQNDMPYLYYNAAALVFPSVFEGFCIPVVEAMRTNCPIVCSECGSIPEIAGDSALYFDAFNPEDIADKINKLMNDPVLKQKLIENGEVRKNLFSWERCADVTMKSIEKIYIQNNKVTELPLVSIITPSYNQGQFIKDTIESVLNQEYPNIEYIVMDGGSTDNTVEILQSYGDRIQWISEKDGGQADAVNKGIQAAKGSIIGWLNSDDTYLEGAISTAVKYLMKYPSVGMVYGEGYYTSKDGEVVDRYLTESFSLERLAENCIICQPTAFFTKEAILKVGCLDKDLHLCMDYELWMKMAKITEIAYIPNYLATSRMYQENKTLGRRSEVFEEVCRTVKKYYGYVPLTWVYGYADYKTKGKKNLLFTYYLTTLFLKYNLTNIKYSSKVTCKLLKRKLKYRIKRDKFTHQYDDLWVSKVFIKNILVPIGATSLSLRGRHLWPYKDDLKIKVMLNDVKVQTLDIKEKGEFKAIIKLSEMEVPRGKTIEIKIMSNKTFCPQLLGINNDVRFLAFILDQIEFV